KKDATHRRMRMMARTVRAVGNWKCLGAGGASPSLAPGSVTTAVPLGSAATASTAAPLGLALTASAAGSPGCVPTALTSDSAMRSPLSDDTRPAAPGTEECRGPPPAAHTRTGLTEHQPRVREGRIVGGRAWHPARIPN